MMPSHTNRRAFLGGMCGVAVSMGVARLCHADDPAMPRIDGDWQLIVEPPKLEQYHKDGVEAVDFTLYPAADGRWQLLSCIRGTAFSGAGRLLYRWEAPQPAGPWEPRGIFRTSQPELGHVEGRMQAPHCVRHGGRYYLFYSSGGAYCMVGDDGKNFTDMRAADGGYRIFDMPRDLMVFENIARDGLWYAFFTDIVPGKYPERKNHTISYRTASRLEGPWSGKHDIGVASGVVDPGYTFAMAESPFVTFRDGWYYRLEQMNVIASRDVRQWPQTVLTTLTPGLPMAYLAPEMIEHQGQHYVAAYHYLRGKGGIYLAKVAW